MPRGQWGPRGVTGSSAPSLEYRVSETPVSGLAPRLQLRAAVTDVSGDAMLRYILPLLMLLSWGCYAVEGAFDNVLAVRGPDMVAVGQTATWNASDACTEREGTVGEGKIPSPDPGNPCSTEQVSHIVGVTVEDPSIFEVVEIRERQIVFRALRRGTTNATVVAQMDDGENRTGKAWLRSEKGDRVVFDPVCNLPQDGGTPKRLPVDQAVAFRVGVLQPHVHYDASMEVLDPDPLVYVEQDRMGNRVYRTPARTGEARLTSLLDPEFALPMAFYSAADVEEIEVQVRGASDDPTQPIVVGQEITTILDTGLVIDGARVCVDELTRTLDWETPETCHGGQRDFTPQTTSGRHVFFNARASGTCRFSISVGNAVHVFERTLEVTPR